MPKKIDGRSNFDIVSEGLRKYGGYQKVAGAWINILCPFHAEKTPSCGVYMRQDDPQRPFGFVNCFGCGAHGGWNVLAEKAGLDPIKEWNNGETHPSSVVVNSAVEEDLLGDTDSNGALPLRAILKKMSCPEAQPWPETIPWRGFDGKLISRVGGYIVSDEYNSSVAALFPVRIRRRYVGAVKAVYEKKFKKQLGYINMPGSWSEHSGLFLYNVARHMIRKGRLNFVVLVEGPRDALKLISLGIPVVAVLGAQSFSAKKAFLVEDLGVDYVYVMPDNDAGGSEMWKTVKNAMASSEATVRRLKLPREKDASGKVVKMDPFSAPRAVIKNLKRFLRDTNDWEPYDILADDVQR